MCEPHDIKCHVAKGAHAVGQAAARSYDATLGKLGHSFQQGASRSVEALAGAPADVIGGVKGFYGGAGHKLQGGADNVGQIAIGAANTAGAASMKVVELPGQVLQTTERIVQPIVVGVGDLAGGAGRGLEKTGQGVGDFGKWAGVGVGAVLVVVAIVALVVLAKKGGKVLPA